MFDLPEWVVSTTGLGGTAVAAGAVVLALVLVTRRFRRAGSARRSSEVDSEDARPATARSLMGELMAARRELVLQKAEASRVSGKLRETLSLLLSSEEKFRSIFQRANDCFALSDFETMTIVQANARMAELLGREADEIEGLELSRVWGNAFELRDEGRIKGLARRGSLLRLPIRRKDGAEVPVEVSLSVLDVGGKPMMLSIARDVSERERLLREVESKNRELESRESHLKEANAKLLELQKVKDSFLSSVSHELRTPLTSIRSFSEILLQYKDADQAVKDEFVTIINRESERLTRLINDVLDLAKIEAGQMELALVPLDLVKVVGEVAGSLAPLAAQRQVRLKSDIPENLPHVLGDRDRVQQVLTNLLSNALKFSPEDTEVRVAAEPGGKGLVEVSVLDEGPGIPPEELERIFDKFRQVGDTLTGKPEGTGLGLAICREIITLLGGSIWVRSKVGEGSAFTFTLKAETDERVTALHGGDADGVPLSARMNG